MDTQTSTPPKNETFNISNIAPLDNAYLESLFNSDPDEVSPIESEATAGEPTSDKAGIEIEQPAPEPSKPVSRFIENGSDFIDSLDQNKTEDKKDAPGKEGKATPPSPGDDKATSDAQQLSGSIPAFSKELYELGILTTDQGQQQPDINTPEQLLEVLGEEKKKGAVQILDNILSTYGQDYKDAFYAIYVSGVNPRDYFGQVENISSLEGLDLSVIENQKAVLTRHYKELGWDNNKIASKIEKLENYQDLEEEAKDIHASLLSKEKKSLTESEIRRKEEIAQKAAAEKQHAAGIQQIITEKIKAREFDGIPADEKTMRQLSSYMLEKKWQLGSEQITDFEKEILDLSRPENTELQVKVALLLHLLKTDPTLSRLQKKAVTQETNKMFSFLQRDSKVAKKTTATKRNFFDD